MQGVAKNWVWEEMDPEKRENKIFCPVSYLVKKPATIDSPEVKNAYQKPLPLYWELLARFSELGSLVVELTGGSGTLAAACALKYMDRSGTPFLEQIHLDRVHFFHLPDGVEYAVNESPGCSLRIYCPTTNPFFVWLHGSAAG